MLVHLQQRICYLLSILRIHSPDCVHCNARQTCWDETVRRLNELDPSKHRTLKGGDQQEKTRARDSESPKLPSRSARAAVAFRLH